MLTADTRARDDFAQTVAAVLTAAAIIVAAKGKEDAGMSDSRSVDSETERILIDWCLLSTPTDELASTSRLDGKKRIRNVALSFFFLLIVIKEACQCLRILSSYLQVMGPVADVVSSCFALGAFSLIPIRAVLHRLESRNQVTFITDLLEQRGQHGTTQWIGGSRVSYSGLLEP